MIRLFRRRPRYVVVWWPSPLYDVPELIGPFVSRSEGLRTRDMIRDRQGRTEKMAHLVPLDPPLPPQATVRRRPALRVVTA